MTGWTLIVDVALCINCRNCVLATKDEHAGNTFDGYSVAQPAGGLETIRVERHLRGEGSLIDVTYIPKTCNHCDNAPCIKASNGAITKRTDGIVLIDPQKSQGRRDLVDACPYGMIEWNEEAQVPQNWTFDAHLLDAGWTEPRCAQACPTKAIRAVKVSGNELQSMVSAEGLTVLHPEFGTAPRVYYRGLADTLSHMVGGNLYRGDAEGHQRNLAGAEVVLVDSSDRIERMTKTDYFGDFRFSGLPAVSSTVEVKVRVNGKLKVLTNQNRSGSVNLGSFKVD